MNQDYAVTERGIFTGPMGEVRSFLARPFLDKRYSPRPFLDLSYQVRPYSDEPIPALVVVFEVYGLADHIEQVCWRLAQEGYVALAPDLYSHDPAWKEMSTWDVERGRAASRSNDAQITEQALTALDPAYVAGARRAITWLRNHDTNTYLPDLHAAVDYLRSRPDVDPERIGVIGFCMGGGLAGALSTQRSDLAATVIYYGPPPRPEDVPKVGAPVMAHYGAFDDLAARAPEFERAMEAHGKDLQLYIYPSAPHRFFNETRPFYQPDPARLSWNRTLAFLKNHLTR